MTGTFYLNNDGSRWVNLPRSEKHRFLLICPDGKYKIRLADFFEAFGNFSVTHFRYCGKRYAECYDGVDEETGLPIIDLQTYQD